MKAQCFPLEKLIFATKVLIDANNILPDLYGKMFEDD